MMSHDRTGRLYFMNISAVSIFSPTSYPGHHKLKHPHQLRCLLQALLHSAIVSLLVSFLFFFLARVVAYQHLVKNATKQPKHCDQIITSHCGRLVSRKDRHDRIVDLSPCLSIPHILALPSSKPLTLSSSPPPSPPPPPLSLSLSQQ